MIYDIDGIKMELDSSRFIDSKIILGQFERNTLQEVLNILRPGDTFIDVGANIGFYTLHAARKVGVNGSVLACEPEFESYSKLYKNSKLNGLYDGVHLYPWALGSWVGEVGLNVKNDWGECMSSTVFAPKGSTEMYQVVQTTLDTLMKVDREVAPQIRLVKIDVEGAELSVLKGAANLFAQRKIDYVCVEFTKLEGYSDNFEEIAEYLDEAGMRCTEEPFLLDILAEKYDMRERIANLFFKREDL